MKRLLLCCLACVASNALAQQCSVPPSHQSQDYSSMLIDVVVTYGNPQGSCSGPGGNAVPGTPIGFSAGGLSGVCQVPFSTSSGTGVGWNLYGTVGGEFGASSVCDKSGEICGVWYDFHSDLNYAQMEYQNGAGSTDVSTCIGGCVGGDVSACIQTCYQNFSCAFGLDYWGGVLACPYSIVDVETYSCPSGRNYDAPLNCCCASNANQPCANGLSYYDCNGNCAGYCDDASDPCYGQPDCCGGSDPGCSDNMGAGCEGCGTIDCDGQCEGGCPGGGGGGQDPCDTAGCSPCVDVYVYGRYEAECEYADPVIIDLDGSGFDLTSIEHGVLFDFYRTGNPIQMAWTAEGSNVGWLILDRDGNGTIDSGWELFSNVTPQPGLAADHLGFKGLAMFDTPAYGGNGDGWINAKDAIYARLRVWVDKNHNGMSEPDELLTLPQAGITAISVNYQKSNWTDAYGNQFQNKAKIVRNAGGSGNGKGDGNGGGQDQWSYDVVLLASPAK